MSLSERLGIAANAVTIALAIIVGVVLVKGSLTPTHVRASVQPIQVGADMNRLPLKINWSSNRRTLVLGLQTSCHYCTDSAPFFRRLMNAATGNVRTVALLPQPVDAARRYLDGIGVRVDEIRQVSLSSLGVTGTPTLVLVDGAGQVKEVWVGKLAPEGQASVLSVITNKVVRPTKQETDSVSEEPQTKSVRLERIRPGLPGEIVQVLEGDTDVTPTAPPEGQNPEHYRRATGKPFQAGEDWLKNIVFVLKNLSGKNVVAVNFLVDFPDTAPMPAESVIGQPISVGQLPEHALYNWHTGQKHPQSTSAPMQLTPGSELRIALAPYYDQMKAAIEEKVPMSAITTCWIRIQVMYFADGTRWAGGEFEKPDPSTPGRYIRISPEEFNNATHTS